MAHYGKADYWNDRYTKDQEPFDWYQRWNGLEATIKEIGVKSPILHVGTGTSRIPIDMAEAGFSEQICTDISTVAIDLMKKQADGKSGLKFQVADVTSMTEFGDASFETVIEKGTLDSLLCAEDASEEARKMIQEVDRVLRPGGVFVCICYGKPTYRNPYLQLSTSWVIETKEVPKPRLSTETFPILEAEKYHFIYICKKSSGEAELKESV